MKPTRGWSLVEVIVVVAILMVLMAVAGLALAGAMKKSAAQTEMRGRLKQLAAGVNLYRMDHDEISPSYLHIVANGLSTRDPFSGQGLHYTHGGDLRGGYGGRRWEDFGYEATKDPIIKVIGWNDHKGDKVPTKILQPNGSFFIYDVPAKAPGGSFKMYGVRLDGSLGWFPDVCAWRLNVPPSGNPPPGTSPPKIKGR